MQGVNPTRPHPLPPAPCGDLRRGPSAGAGGDAAATLPIFFENGEGSPTRVRWTGGGGSNSRGDAMFSRFLEKMRTDQVTKKAQDEQPSRANNYYSTNVLLLQEAGGNGRTDAGSRVKILNIYGSGERSIINLLQGAGASQQATHQPRRQSIREYYRTHLPGGFHIS